uniref:Uncharacterized protein n=1 Tax=Rhizophora mucronata TaxID=61149 RepID=A0A2P2PRY0_RHIMU
MGCALAMITGNAVEG